MSEQLKTMKWTIYFDELTSKAQEYLIKNLRDKGHLKIDETLNDSYDLGEMDLVIDPTDFIKI